VQSLWMFFADLLAAFIPGIPFAFFSLDTACIVSISITAILLLPLGVVRCIVARSSILRGALETLGIWATLLFQLFCSNHEQTRSYARQKRKGQKQIVHLTLFVTLCRYS